MRARKTLAKANTSPSRATMPFSLGHLVAARVRDDDTQPRRLRLPGPFRLRSRERLPGEGEGAPTHREDQSVSLALLPTLQGEDCHERKALRPQRSCVPILLALLSLALAGCSVIDEIITMVEGVDGMVSEASEGVERTAHPGGGGSRGRRGRSPLGRRSSSGSSGGSSRASRPLTCRSP